jgi:cytochrome b561
MLRNTFYSYGAVSKFLHWLTAVCVLLMLLVGYFMDDISSPALQNQVYNLHKLMGLFILFLMLVRLIWRLTNPLPWMPPRMNRLETAFARLIQRLFYPVLILMSLAGWAMSTAFGYPPHIGILNLPLPGLAQHANWAPFLAKAHETLGYVIIGLLSLHVAGALKHFFINKDGILQRMLPRCCHRKNAD